MRAGKKCLIVARSIVFSGFAITTAPAAEWQTATPQSVGADPTHLMQLG
jgi:hypothetical protein